MPYETMWIFFPVNFSRCGSIKFSGIAAFRPASSMSNAYSECGNCDSSAGRFLITVIFYWSLYKTCVFVTSVNFRISYDKNQLGHITFIMIFGLQTLEVFTVALMQTIVWRSRFLHQK